MAVAMIFLLACFLFVEESPPSATIRWAREEGVAQPRGVAFDPKGKRVFIACQGSPDRENKGQGYLVAITPKGDVASARWASGLNGPKGLAIEGQYILVAEFDAVARISLEDGKLLDRYPLKGRGPLDGIAAGGGKIFAAQRNGNRIHALRNGKWSIWTSGDHLHQPNGLYYLPDQLFIACWGGPEEQGAVRVLPILKDAVTSLWSGPIGRLEGIAADENAGTFFVTETETGRLYWVSPAGRVHELLNLKKGLAGCAYLPAQKRLIVAHAGANRVYGIRISDR